MDEFDIDPIYPQFLQLFSTLTAQDIDNYISIMSTRTYLTEDEYRVKKPALEQQYAELVSKGDTESANIIKGELDKIEACSPLKHKEYTCLLGYKKNGRRIVAIRDEQDKAEYKLHKLEDELVGWNEQIKKLNAIFYALNSYNSRINNGEKLEAEEAEQRDRIIEFDPLKKLTVARNKFNSLNNEKNTCILTIKKCKISWVALLTGKDPDAVQRYLKEKFGD